MERLGEYYLVSPLGCGAYGMVHKALNPSGELVAIKSVPTSRRKPEARYLLKKEVSAMRAMKHPNIICLQQVFETTNEVHLVMELAAGGDLRSFLNANDILPELVARHLFSLIAKAVRHAHLVGFVHRDLKLENILLDEFDNPKIADWGFACKWSNSTKLIDSVGSLFYCAPELLARRPYVGPECDVWSLGVILYALVTSTLPFLPLPDEPNDLPMRQRISSADYTIPEHVSELCSSLIRSMLEVNPAKRMTLEEVLRHPWVQQCTAIRPQLSIPVLLPAKNILRCST